MDDLHYNVLPPQTKTMKATISTDFIRKHIFPGGHLPCLAIIDSIIKQKTSLKEIHSLNIASSYAKALSCWRHTF